MSAVCYLCVPDQGYIFYIRPWPDISNFILDYAYMFIAFRLNLLLFNCTNFSIIIIKHIIYHELSLFVCLMMFNATFNNISVISWQRFKNKIKSILYQLHSFVYIPVFMARYIKIWNCYANMLTNSFEDTKGVIYQKL